VVCGSVFFCAMRFSRDCFKKRTKKKKKDKPPMPPDTVAPGAIVERTPTAGAKLQSFSVRSLLLMMSPLEIF